MIDVLLLIISCGWFCIAGSRRISPPPPANAPSTSGSGVIFSSLPLIFPQIFFTTLQHYITCACLVSIDFFLSLCVRAEDVYKNLKDGKAVPEPEAVKPEPTTEILFLCSYENCGKTFVDVAALRKHAHVHNERQYICQEPGCGKVVSPHFAPSSMYHVVCDYLFSSARYITEMFLTNMSASFPPALYPDYFPYFVLSFFFHRISSIVTIQQIASKPYL